MFSINSTITISKEGGKTCQLDLSTNYHEWSDGLDAFLSGEDEFSIVDAGDFKLFADVSEFDSIRDLANLREQINRNPVAAYLITQDIKNRQEHLGDIDRGRVTPVIAFNKISAHAFGYTSDVRSAVEHMFGGMFTNYYTGSKIKKCMDDCFNHEAFLNMAIENGYGAAKFVGGLCTNYHIPKVVYAMYNEWLADPDTKRSMLGDSNPAYLGTYIYMWTPVGHNTFTS